MNPKQAAARGAQLLTDHYGHNGWVERINLSTLDLRMSNQCILGQLMDVPFGLALRRLGIAMREDVYGFERASMTQYNFETAERYWRDLNQAWIEIVVDTLDERRAVDESVATSFARTHAHVSDDASSTLLAGV